MAEALVGEVPAEPDEHFNRAVEEAIIILESIPDSDAALEVLRLMLQRGFEVGTSVLGVRVRIVPLD